MANNPRHKDNLKKFPKGKSGNPAGRPPLSELKEILFEEIGEEGIREIVRSLHKSALKGNIRAIEILLDRIFGKVKDQIEVNQPVTVEDARDHIIELLMRQTDEIVDINNKSRYK